MVNSKILSLSYFIIISGLLFSQCKKYEEDNVLIQWRKPEKRLIKFGPWVFEKLTVDGVDKSIEFRADSAYFDKIEFRNHEEHSTDIRINRSNSNLYERGLYKIIESNTILNISAFSNTVSDIVNFGPIFNQVPVNWEILRLTKKGIKLKTNFNSSEYILELKPE